MSSERRIRPTAPFPEEYWHPLEGLRPETLPPSRETSSGPIHLQDLLGPLHERDAAPWEAFLRSLPEDPDICWYPSAGTCFRDLFVLDLFARAGGEHSDRRRPDVFLHLDGSRYIHRMAIPTRTTFERGACGAPGTRVEVQNQAELRFRVPFRFGDPWKCHEHFDFRTPMVHLLDVRVSSEDYGSFRAPVLYFAFENNLFMEEILLRHGLRISHLFRVREGLGLGLCRGSMGAALGFLDLLGCEWILTDGRIRVVPDVFRDICLDFALPGEAKGHLESLGFVGNYSGFDMCAFRLTGSERLPREDFLNRNLGFIQETFHTLSLDSYY